MNIVRHTVTQLLWYLKTKIQKYIRMYTHKLYVYIKYTLTYIFYKTIDN